MSGRLDDQLRRLGLERGCAPDADGWERLLAAVDRSYSADARVVGRLRTRLVDTARESDVLAQDLSQSAARQVAEHRALHRVATAVASSYAPEDVAQLVTQEMADALGLRVCFVARFDDHHATVVGSVGPGTNPGLRFPLTSDGPLARVRASLRATVASAPDLTGRAHSWLAVPVVVSGSAWGAIATAEPLTGADQVVGRMSAFADLVGLAIENAEAHRKLSEQAARDPLTGLYNHRIFHEALKRSVAEAKRATHPMSLILFDIDYFKQVNDTHGHQTGDEVLADLAERLRAVVRAGDTIARVGGEEFAWIAAASGGEEALAAAERLRAAVRAAPFGTAGRITISVGICDLARATAAEDLYRLADGALYWAKEQGRDRCVLYAPDVVASLSVREDAERARRAQSLAAVRSLARAVDAKDSSTRFHSERVAAIACRLAEVAGWPLLGVERLREAGLLHDVGKIGLSDEILLNRGALSPEQTAAVRTHTELGVAIASGLLDEEQLSWIRGHHERWDGTGYPDGLPGDRIPVGARLLAVADALDAMLHDRAYRSGMSLEDAVAEIRDGRGAQFAPGAVDLLEDLIRRDGLESLLEDVSAAVGAPVHGVA